MGYKCVICFFYLQAEHMRWVFKRTMTIRVFLLVPKTHIKTRIREKNRKFYA